MPAASDWRSSANYAYLNDLDPAELAWEFLRRNPDYQRDHRAPVRSDPGADEGNDASAKRWGLRFRRRSQVTRKSGAPVLVAAIRSPCHFPERGVRRIQ
jgi:hypothetical protein